MMSTWEIVACLVGPFALAGLILAIVLLIERAYRPGICPSCGQRAVRSRNEFTSAKYSIDVETCYLCGYERRVIG